MKILIALSMFLLGFKEQGYAQQINENFYSVSIQSKLSFEETSMLDSVIHVELLVQTLVDDRFCLFIAEVQSLYGSVLPPGEQGEPDTALFDLRKNIMYVLSERRSYPFKVRSIPINSTSGDTLFATSKDTVITLSKKLDRHVISSPLAGNFPYGIREYRTKNQIVTYLRSRKIDFSLSRFYERVKDFPFVNMEYPMQF